MWRATNMLGPFGQMTDWLLHFIYDSLFWSIDSPRRISLMHWISWLFAAIGVFMVLLAHGHYTIDVLVAYYITTRLFWTYHTLTNNSFLLKVSWMTIQCQYAYLLYYGRTIDDIVILIWLSNHLNFAALRI